MKEHAATIGCPWMPKHDYVIRYLMTLPNKDGIASVMDVGCHDGRVMQVVKRCLPNAKVVGEAHIADMLDLSRWDDDTFDLVTNLFNMHYVTDMDKALSETLRLANKRVLLGIDKSKADVKWWLGWLSVRCGAWDVDGVSQATDQAVYISIVAQP